MSPRILSVSKVATAFVAVALAATICPAQGRELWFPVEVDVWDPPFNTERSRERRQYTALDSASQRWSVCALIPHLKDAYWLAVNHGLIDEARRLEVGVSLYQAGGYDHLEMQREQVEECLENGADGLIVGAIAQDGLADLIERAAARGVPVIDLINGISSPHITARVAVDFWDTGFQAGSFLRSLPGGSERPVRVAWFPGPEGAGWVEAGDAGFRDALEGSSIEIVATRQGDTGRATQSALIEEVLEEHGGELDYIVGTTVTAEAAVDLLRRRELSEEIGVISYYYSPGVHRGVRRGTILAAPTDQQALQARIALDVMVRILEKKDYLEHVAPRVQLIDRDRLLDWDSSTTLAPRGFRPIFSINQ